MSAEQFPDTFYVKILNNGVIERIATFQAELAQELQYIVLNILQVGTPVGTEQLRLHLYTNAYFTGAYATSAWANLSDMTTGTNTFGYLRFDFDRQNISPDFTYYLGIETQNYTRNVLTFYLAVKLDWPDDIYTAASTSRGAQMRLIGWR